MTDKTLDGLKAYEIKENEKTQFILIETGDINIDQKDLATIAAVLTPVEGTGKSPEIKEEERWAKERGCYMTQIKAAMWDLEDTIGKEIYSKHQTRIDDILTKLVVGAVNCVKKDFEEIAKNVREEQSKQK
jgi:hypothetical protein